MRRALSWAVMPVLLLAHFAGCGKKTSETDAEKMIESAMRAEGRDVDVKINSETVQFSSKDGEMSFGEGTKLPDTWPADVPVYSDLKLLTALSTEDGFSIQGTASDPRDKIAAYYKEQAAKNGWAENSTLTQPDMVMLTYTKDERDLAIMISAQGAETAVSISITNK